MYPIRAVFVIMYGKQNENRVKMKNICPLDCIIYEHQSNIQGAVQMQNKKAEVI